MRVRPGRFRKLLLCVVLEYAALAGMPMRPDEIVRLMQNLSRAQVVHTEPAEAEAGDD
jgi:hypothetical protein